MDKVDLLLKEIYLEMEMEELQEQLDWMNEQLDNEVLTEGLKEDLMAQFNSLRSKLPELMNKAKTATGPAKEAIFKQIKNIQAQMGPLKAKIAKAASGAVQKGQEVAGQAGKAISQKAGEAGEAISKGAQQAGGAISKAAGQAKDLAVANPSIAAGAAAIAAIAASVVIYKKFFSQAARACKGKSGPDKKNCVNSFKAKGLQAAKAKVMSGMSKCKDPKCKAKLQSKAQGFDAKIGALKGGMAESMIDSYVGDYISEIKDLIEQDSKN